MQLSTHVLSPLVLRCPQHPYHGLVHRHALPSTHALPTIHAAPLPKPVTSDSPMCKAAHLEHRHTVHQRVRQQHLIQAFVLHAAYKGTRAAQNSHYSRTKAVPDSKAVTKQRRIPSTPGNPAQKQRARASVPTAATTRGAQRRRLMLRRYSTGRAGTQAAKVQHGTQSIASTVHAGMASDAAPPAIQAQRQP